MVRGLRFLIAGGLLAATLVAALPGGARAGGGCHEPAPNTGATEGAGTAVELADCAFGPTVLRIAPGAQVTWTNTSKAVHSVTGLNGLWGDTKELLPGNAISYSFDAEGTYPYSCVLHPGMVGAVVVGDGISGSVQAGAAVREVAGGGPGAGNSQSAEASSSGDGDGVSATAAGLAAGFAGLLAGAVVSAAVVRRRGMPG